MTLPCGHWYSVPCLEIWEFYSDLLFCFELRAVYCFDCIVLAFGKILGSCALVVSFAILFDFWSAFDHNGLFPRTCTLVNLFLDNLDILLSLDILLPLLNRPSHIAVGLSGSGDSLALIHS